MMNNQPKELIKTARVAGIWYLLMAISGIVGFLILHSKVYNADPQQTLNNLMEATSMARLRLLMEFMIILSQALTAVWFYKLFKDINNTAALATGIWGTVNTVIITVSAIAMAAAIKIALSDHPEADKVLVIDLLTNLIRGAWGVGGLFFGMWLLPLGYIVTSSGRMPVWLGRTLILGGVGYLLSTFIAYAGVSGSWESSLTIPATIGEFWMIGYLLIFGIRPEKE
ncbi:DUF4386 domain-containing protein [Robertkochia sediminum]|uniref:DUF4386 domain-containing protein n=1 Tax=Robertkochia sediminum TaxID=2785326 RepID=UPI001F45C68D|nr:DUF4386 domain-containing protein [Robertkochia sediminum]MBL7472027.1 DUF4386 domain-containing protein [Robertkochia sediminum]